MEPINLLEHQQKDFDYKTKAAGLPEFLADIWKNRPKYQQEQVVESYPELEAKEQQQQY